MNLIVLIIRNVYLTLSDVIDENVYEVPSFEFIVDKIKKLIQIWINLNEFRNSVFEFKIRQYSGNCRIIITLAHSEV